MRQHKRNSGGERLLGLLATGHGAVHHFVHIMPAIHVGVGRSLLFLVMMLRDRAVFTCAAAHRVRRPCGTGQRSIQGHSRKQTYPRGEDSLALLARGNHVFCSLGHPSCLTNDTAKRCPLPIQYVSHKRNRASPRRPPRLDFAPLRIADCRHGANVLAF
jgi:hypothetical protein